MTAFGKIFFDYEYPEGVNKDELINFTGTTRNEFIVGNQLDNHIIGGGGNDVLFGGAGSDTLEVTGDDSCVLFGGDGDDLLMGGGRSDSLFGDDGKDSLKGGGGDDFIVGGAGADWLEGGEGRDTFRYQDISDSTPQDADWLVDFVSGEDKIDLTPITKGSALIFVEKFTGQAGEAVLGYDLTVDFNGDGVADFRVMTVGQAATTDIVA